MAFSSNMQRDPDMYGRTEFGWFLGSLTLATTIAGGLPIDWWWRILVGVVLAFALLPVLGWLSGPFGRVLRFLLAPVQPLPTRHWTGSRMTVGKAGADNDDPNASRVMIEFDPGDLHPHYVLPAGDDPLPLFRETIKTVNPNVTSVRAMKGYDEVKRWSPSRWTRVTLAWRRAAQPERMS
ncbi:hypothetical protein CFP66_39810 [Pseudonocardia sp. MH-G8]|nr:hypothetical protein CFP66_39810 [Pseudonocardia sp. MH-G8]